MCNAHKNNFADHKENLNKPWGRSALPPEAMYKLGFESFISTYSCLPLFTLLPLLSSLMFPSSLFCLSSSLVTSFLHNVALSFTLLSWDSPFFCFCSSFSSSLSCSPLWVVVVPYKSADVNHHVPALCSIGYTTQATKSLLINTWMWYTCSYSLSPDTLNLTILFLHVFSSISLSLFLLLYLAVIC